MELDYNKRLVDCLLIRELQGNGAVLVEGTKWCGAQLHRHQGIGTKKAWLKGDSTLSALSLPKANLKKP